LACWRPTGDEGSEDWSSSAARPAAAAARCFSMAVRCRSWNSLSEAWNSRFSLPWVKRCVGWSGG
jgi:hypothetical protein